MESKTLVDDSNDCRYGFNLDDYNIWDFFSIRAFYIYNVLVKSLSSF